MDIQGPDAGSEASELGGSTQGSPCLLGPHGEGLCSDTETPGEAGSSGRGRHGRLSIRGGGLIRVHPGGGAALHSKWGKNPMWHPVSGSLPLPWQAAGRAMDDKESASH